MKIDSAALIRMLRGFGHRIRANHEILSKLDSFGGDGDHGTTMLRAVTRLEQTLDGSSTAGMGNLLKEVGWAILGVDGGATGPLFGTFFMSASEAVGERDTLDAEGLASMLEAGLRGVRKRTQADVGDKTLMDALVPAVEAARGGDENDPDVLAVLRMVAEAAEDGAGSTEQLRARFGRAKNLGEGSVGSEDPGARSVALMFQGFLDGILDSAM